MLQRNIRRPANKNRNKINGLGFADLYDRALCILARLFIEMCILTNAKVFLLLPMVRFTIQSRKLLVAHDLLFPGVFVAGGRRGRNLWQETLRLVALVV